MLILEENPYLLLQLISVTGALFSLSGMASSVIWQKAKANNSAAHKNNDTNHGSLSSEQEFFSRFEEIPYPGSESENKPDVINLAKKMDEEKNKWEI